MTQLVGRTVAPLLFVLFLFGAGFESFSNRGMTEAGYVAFAILLLAAILWITEAVPLFVTSLAVLFLCLVWLAPVMRQSGQAVENSTFLSQFFSEIIILFLGGFVLSAALHKLHLDEWLARSMIRRSGGSIPALLVAVMVITAFLSMWLSNTATAAMMLALVIPMTRRLPETDRYVKCLLLAIPFSANVGGLGTPIGSPPNAIAMQYLQQAGINPGFATWMLIGIPGVVVMLAVAWGVLMLFFRGDSTTLATEDVPIEIQPSIPLLLVVVTALLTIVGWMTSSLHGHHAGTVALIPVLVFFSAGILGIRELRSLSWDVLILMGGGLCLGTAISTSGLADWMIDQLPVAGVPVYVLMIVFGTVACIMSSVMSNTATANLIMPIILGLGPDSHTPLLIATAFCCSLAMPLPVSTPPNAMAFSSERISVADMFKPGTVITVVGVLLAFTTGYWWWQVVGLL